MRDPMFYLLAFFFSSVAVFLLSGSVYMFYKKDFLMGGMMAWGSVIVFGFTFIFITGN